MYSRNNHSIVATRNGFSLIEIMVVIVIIGLLAGVLAVNVRGYFAQSKVDVAKLQLSKLVDQMELFRGRNGGKYPDQSQGLSALTQPSQDTGESLVRSADIVDPWKNPFVYLTPGKDGQPFEIISLGADGTEGGAGENKDISHLDL